MFKVRLYGPLSRTHTTYQSWHKESPVSDDQWVEFQKNNTRIMIIQKKTVIQNFYTKRTQA